MPEIWFWQLIISPHMAELAVALARRGCRVVCVAGQAMSPERSTQGWITPNLPGVTLRWVDGNESVRLLVNSANSSSVHLCQGIRANGYVGSAQRILAARGMKQFAMMETVEDSGWRGLLKRLAYRAILRRQRGALSGVLAIGHRMPSWIAARGVPADRIFSFAYFLSDRIGEKDVAAVELKAKDAARAFRFIFVGRLIPLKRVDWLINALGLLSNRAFELWIVGSGSEENALKEMALCKLGECVRWFGQISMADIPSVVSQADCLVLPSVHDGWGAVCSEALMVGTPVICSDACGASDVVRASGVGGVFPRDDPEALVQLLAQGLNSGCVNLNARGLVAEWAKALGAAAGAEYLLNILSNPRGAIPPWRREDSLQLGEATKW